MQGELASWDVHFYFWGIRFYFIWCPRPMEVAETKRILPLTTPQSTKQFTLQTTQKPSAYDTTPAGIVAGMGGAASRFTAPIKHRRVERDLDNKVVEALRERARKGKKTFKSVNSITMRLPRFKDGLRDIRDVFDHYDGRGLEWDDRQGGAENLSEAAPGSDVGEGGRRRSSLLRHRQQEGDPVPGVRRPPLPHVPARSLAQTSHARFLSLSQRSSTTSSTSSSTPSCSSTRKRTAR